MFRSSLRKKVLAYFISTAMIFSLTGINLLIPSLLFPSPALAAAVISPSTIGLLNGNFPGAPIKASSNPIAITKLSITASQANTYLQSITVNFSANSGGSPLATTTLANIGADANSGVAVYNDAGGGNAGSFGSGDLIVATSTNWLSNSSSLTLTPASPTALSLATSSASVFYLVIRTSAGAVNGTEIIATIPANGIVTSDGSGPSSNFSANSLRVDTSAPTIANVSGFAGNNQISIRFSKPVQKVSGGNLAASDFAYVDNGGSAQTIASVSHTAGQDSAVITLSGNLDAADIGASTFAAASSAIADMAGNAMGTGTSLVSSPVTITTATIPSTVVANASTYASPLVTFAAEGGTSPYTWKAASANDETILSGLGLTSIDASTGTSTGKLFGTIANVAGSFNFNLKAIDSLGASTTKQFTINIAATSGGGIPSVQSISPGGIAQSASGLNVVITGLNTHFTNTSSIQFLLNGVNDTNLTVSSKASTGATNLSFSLAAGAGAQIGSRDVKIVSGTETIFYPNGFNVFASGGSGLNLILPASSATNIPLPPSFSFSPSSNASSSAYRITVKSTADFSGSALWDYTFPAPALASNSHCSASFCDLTYGAGQFRILTQPAFLAPNTIYYWNVRTYNVNPLNVSDNIAPLETTAAQSFTTTASITDGTPPSIFHRPIFQATESVNLEILARVMDNLATASTTPALTSKAYYCAGASCTPSSNVNGVHLGGGYFKYTIPSASVGVSGAIVRYYLQASDGTNTFNFKNAGDTPFQLSTTAAGAASISGNVKDSSANNLSGAIVFAEGTGFNTMSDGSGNFILSNLPAGVYDIAALKDGYAERKIEGMPTGSIGLNFSLPAGQGGGFGGDVTKPRIMFNGPNEGMTGIPGNDSNFKIFVVFSKSMSENSLTASGTLAVKEINPTTGSLTDITTTKGAWTYYASNPPAVVPQNDNVAVWAFSGANTFGDNKTIAVVVSQDATDTAGNSIQGNQPDGSYAFSFTTGSTANFSGFNAGTGEFSGGGTFGEGAFIAPHVVGSTPAPGGLDVPRNTKIVINFSNPMADDGGGYILKNFTKLYSVSSSNTETDVSSLISTATLNSDKMTATITLTGSLSASTKYRLKVLGGAKAASGMTIAPPSQSSNAMYNADFKTGSTSDTAAPTIVGSYPNDADTNVPVNMGAVNIGFSKDIDVATINTNTFYLSIGSTAINGTVEYRPMERQAFFMPKNALNPNTTYTVNITTGVTALNGTALAANSTRTFTTAGADTTSPTINFVNADDYNLAITFSEPMNSAKAVDTTNFSASVLKAANYAIKYGTNAELTSGGGTSLTIPSSASFTYDNTINTVMIEKYTIESAATILGKEIIVTVTGVKDLSGNAITTGNGNNSGRAPIQNSSSTKGALGPMAMSTDAFSGGGNFVPANFSTNSFGFVPQVEVRPFNMMTGQTTIYGIRLPISSQLTNTGTSTIILTFPTGFDISGAKQDINSPMRSDLNGPGTGTVKFKCASSVASGKTCSSEYTVSGDASGDTNTKGGSADDGIVVNSSARTVTIYLSGDTAANDFLTIDLAGIKNSTVPKDFNTSGYSVDVKTKIGSVLKESLTSMPFFLQSGGSYTLSGTVTAATATSTSATTKIYIGSPLTGPMETEVTFSGGGGSTATYSFPNLPSGEYFIFTDPYISLGDSNFAGKANPERIFLSGNTTYNFSLSSTSSGTNVTLNIIGPANEALDIFANSPTGFRSKQITLNSNAGDTESFTINLPDGKWNIGVGPQMPKGMNATMPPAPSYLPPKPVDVAVSGAFIAEASGTANDGILAFTLTSATKSIKGVVKDGANKVIASAEVYAYSPYGGFGTHAQSDTNGAFTLNVTDGSYVIGAFVPGMPSSKEVPVVVTDNATTYLLIDGATTAITPAAAVSSFVLKLAKPDYTISGKVTDGTNVVQGASVYAYRTDGPGNANALTDSSGNYTLYVSNGSWKVGTFLPQYGQLSESSVTVSGANQTNQNLSPASTGTFYTVSGTVTVGGSNQQGAFVRISGNNTFNETITGSDGTYSFKVPSGNGYIIKAFIPGMGEVPPLAAFNVSADTANKNITVAALNTITILTSANVSQAFIDVSSLTGVGGFGQINNATSTTLSLPNGTYKIQAHIPGLVIGNSDISATATSTTAYSSSTGILTVDGNESLTITIPSSTFRTVSGTVTDGTNNIADAWVEIGNPTTGVHTGTKTGTNGSFSLQVVDSASNYFLNAMKPGYFGEPSLLTVNGANLTGQTLTISTAAITISGQVLIGSSGAANAFIRAEKQGGGFSGTQADTNGNYILPVANGTWKIYAVAEGYAETAFASNPITVSGSALTGKNITLSSTVSLNPPKSKSITPASGGTLDNTDAGIKLTIPANALGSSASAGNIQAKETNNIRETASAKPVAGKAQEIKATDSDGNPINTLNGSVTVAMSYSTADLATTESATDSSVNTKDEADKLKMAYWDETTTNWVTLPSTITYYKSDGTVLDGSDEAHTPATDLSNVATTTVSAATTHFSLYAPVSSTDPSAPSAPSGLAAAAASASQINLTWSAVSGATSYDIYRSTTSGGTYTRLGSEPTVSSGSTTSYSDTGLSAATTYYYQITAINNSGESAASSAVSAATENAATPGGAVIIPSSGGGGSASAEPTTYQTYNPDTGELSTGKEADNSEKVSVAPEATKVKAETSQEAKISATPGIPAKDAKGNITLEQMAADAELINQGHIEKIAEAMGAARDTKAESNFNSTITAKITKGLIISSAIKNIINNFVTYGTKSTKALGAGERAGVVNSFKAAMGKMPETAADWNDVVKIANGRWPNQTNKRIETKAEKIFKQIYKRSADRKNSHDDAAVTVMAYGLRPANRNLSSEKSAIKSFKAIFKYAPKDAQDWDAVRAIAYSGATR